MKIVVGNYKVEYNKKQMEVCFGEKRKLVISSTDDMYAFIRLYVERIEDEAMELKVDTIKTPTFEAFHLFLTALYGGQELMMRDMEYLKGTLDGITKSVAAVELNKEEEDKIIDDDKFFNEHIRQLKK